jgi:uncharacterized membrane protein YkvA (DUF1232 family)
MLAEAKAWARRLKRELAALWIAARDTRTPRAAKWLAAIVVAYAVSPIDLIPDFIPVVGYLDDLVLVPLGIALVIKLIPQHLMQEFRAQAETFSQQLPMRRGLLIVVAIWLSCAAAVVWWLYR